MVESGLFIHWNGFDTPKLASAWLEWRSLLADGMPVDGPPAESLASKLLQMREDIAGIVSWSGDWSNASGLAPRIFTRAERLRASFGKNFMRQGSGNCRAAASGTPLPARTEARRIDLRQTTTRRKHRPCISEGVERISRAMMIPTSRTRRLTQTAGYRMPLWKQWPEGKFVPWKYRNSRSACRSGVFQSRGQQ